MLYLYEKEILETIKSIVEEFKDKIFLAVIYGSFARRKHAPDSDIDMLIIGDKTIRDKLIDCFSEIYVQYSIMVPVVFYSYAQFKKIQNHPFIKNALENGMIIWARKKIE